MKPTEEQVHCISTAVVHDVVVIEATAGAGKSSTLKLISDVIREKSLYLAFNKGTATEASEKFEGHVECRTTHSIAYQAFGREMNHKLSRPKGKYVNVAGTSSEIAKYYKLSKIDVDVCGTAAVTPSFLGLLVKTAVQRFEQSLDMSLSNKHLPWGELKEIEKKFEICSTTLAASLLSAANSLWKDRINLRSNVLATHDTYLKLWQLSKPQLGYKVIYLDECQDSTHCVLDVVNSQKDTKLIMVGDSRQNIYNFRGAVNGMELSTGIKCTLSKSFRYGQAIADIAKIVLANAIDITGREDIASVVGEGVVDKNKPFTVLCRTNAYLLDAATGDIERGRKVAIEIDVKDFVKVLESSLALFVGDAKGVKHEKVIPYAKWVDFLEEAKQGGEFARMVNIVQAGRAPRMIQTLLAYNLPDNPEIIYTTAHKSKGREFSQVILAEDFPSHYDKKGAFVGLSIDEQNLLYVSVTRAINVLETNTTVQEAIAKFGKIVSNNVDNVEETEYSHCLEEAL